MTDLFGPRDLSHHAPAPKPLSTAAQAVMIAATNGNTNIVNDPVYRQCIAAALHAVADQVVPERDCPDTEEWVGQSAWVQAESGARFRLLAIAAELKGGNG